MADSKVMAENGFSEMNGKLTVNEWNAEFRWIETPIGLIVDELTIEGLRTTIGTEPFAVESDKPATWRALIVRDALQMLLEDKAPDNLREIDVRIEPKGIIVAARAKIVFEVPVEVTCDLEIVDKREIRAKVVSVSIGGGPAKSFVQRELDKLNPLIDSSTFPFDLRFGSVEYRSGEIVIGGTLATGSASKPI